MMKMKKMEMVKTRNRSRSQSLAVVFTDLERKGNSHINKWPTFSYFQLLNSLSYLSSGHRVATCGVTT